MMNEMNTLIPNEIGLWIECCYPGCKKWRYSLDFDDPLAVPKKWYCHMNSDQSTNDCSIPECLDLDEGEIFVESKFKAGCIVWAKVLGYPWSVAMVDFCPEFECYYWFDDIDSNVPSQYHVTFLGGKNVTRAWVKSKYLKSFRENSDPSFVLKSRVHGKKMKTHQQAEILKGCEIARSALSLSIKSRLKKYNFNSWKIVQRLQRQFPKSRRESRVSLPATETNDKKNSAKVTGPNNIKKSLYQTKAKAGEQIDVEGPSRKEKSSCSAPVNRNDSKSDSAPLIETQNSNVHGSDDSSVLDDTRSISSFISKDFIETRSNEDERSESPQIPESQMIVPGFEDESGVNEDNDKNSSDKENESIEIASDNPDEIVPSSQPSTPREDSFSRMILKKLSDERDENYNRKDKSGETLGAKNSISMSKLSEKLKSMKQGKRQRFAGNLEVRKSASENVLSSSTGNKENYLEKSRYLRALSEFTRRSEANSLSSASSKNTINDLPQEKKITNPRKNLPSWFTNPDEKRIIQSQRLERLSKLSDEEDRRMYEENRRSFIKEIESPAPVVTAGSSKDENKNRRAKAKPLNNYMGTQNVDDLLTSDEDSL